jgi:hypothetical protein
MILLPTLDVLLLLRSVKDFPHQIVGDLIGRALLLEGHTHRHLVKWDLEDTEPGLEPHPPNVRSERRSTKTIIGGTDHHHPEH